MKIFLLTLVLFSFNAFGIELKSKDTLPKYDYSTQELTIPSIQILGNGPMKVDSVILKLNSSNTYEIIRYDSGACGFSPTSVACSIYNSTN